MLSHVVSLRNLISFLTNASVKELSALPKIGPQKLHQILELRSSCRESQLLLTLKDISSIRGLSSKLLGTLAGNSHVTEIIDICNYVELTFGTIKYPDNVVSIDLGINEVAMSRISMGMSLLEWKRVPLLSLRPYTPEACYEQVNTLFSQLCTIPESKQQEQEERTVYLIESQSHRPVSPQGAGFMDVSLRLRLLEAVMYTLAIERNLPIYRISPTKVGRYFNLESGRYSRKKRAAVVTATHLLGVSGIEKTPTPLGRTLEVNDDSLIDFFWSQKKLDDLSDSLLQGVAFIDWIYLHKLCTTENN